MESDFIIRPKNLTILCILSFIGNSFYFILTVWAYISISKSEEVVKTLTNSRLQTKGYVNEMGSSLLNAYNYAIPNLFIGLFCATICFYGVLLIWKLQKKGFYIYTLGELIPPIASFFIGVDSLIGGISSVVFLLNAVIWIILYAINFNYLKK